MTCVRPLSRATHQMSAEEEEEEEMIKLAVAKKFADCLPSKNKLCRRATEQTANGLWKDRECKRW